ncbi:MAG: hypothetical protein K0R72_533 [Clostridia bacterium]|jgi:hypothetical protein|nr:hypothetical protein [Clostridia bacterium]
MKIVYDKKVAMVMVSKDGCELKHLSKELRNDKEVVIAAAYNNGRSLIYASEELKNDREFLLSEIKKGYIDYKYIKDLNDNIKNDKEASIAAIISYKRDLFRSLGYDSKHDKDVILTQVKTHGYVNIPEDNLANKEIVHAIVMIDPSVIRLLDVNYKNDINFAKMVLEMHPSAMVFFPRQTLENPEINNLLYDESGYNRSTGYEKNGYNREWLNESGELKKIFSKSNRKFESKQDYINLVNEYLELKTSRKAFCEKNNIRLDEFNSLLADISVEDAGLKEEFNKSAQRSAEVYIHQRNKLIECIISGEKSIYEYAKKYSFKYKFHDLLKNCKSHELSEKLMLRLLDGIKSKEISPSDMINMTSDIKSSSRYEDAIKEYDNLMMSCKHNNNINKTYISSMHSLKNELAVYKAGFNKEKYLSSNPTVGKIVDGKFDMVQVTEEHIENAKKYLKLTGQYICNKTVMNITSKFATGQLNPEEVFKDYTEEQNHCIKELVEQQKEEKDDLNKDISEIQELNDKINSTVVKRSDKGIE